MNQKTEKPSASDYDGLVKFVSWTPFIAGAILFILVVAYVVTFYENGWPKDQGTWGQFGDYIGGLLNPLVAGFALVALAVSIRIQKTELTETREELKESRQAMQDQARIAEQQRSEQRFFDLLNIYKFTLENQSFSQQVAAGSTRILEKFSGKEAISRIYSWISPVIEELEKIIYKNPDFSLDDIRVDIDIWGDNSSIPLDKIAAYSRVVLLIIKIAEDDSDINEKYVSLFINQLTNEELFLIAIYIIFDISRDGEQYINAAKKSGLFSKMQGGIISIMMKKYFLENPSF